jgi:hypothetical protein
MTALARSGRRHSGGLASPNPLHPFTPSPFTLHPLHPKLLFYTSPVQASSRCTANLVSFLRANDIAEFKISSGHMATVNPGSWTKLKLPMLAHCRYVGWKSFCLTECIVFSSFLGNRFSGGNISMQGRKLYPSKSSSSFQLSSRSFLL